MMSKSDIRKALNDDVADFLRSGKTITVLSSRKRKYRNPVPLSPITLARCQMNAARKAGAKRVANLFPSAVDPAVVRAIHRGRGYRRQRRNSMNWQISVV
jgi:hypothetical protein